MRAARAVLAIALLLPFANALPLPRAEPPLADFTWQGSLPREPVTFTSTSSARNGTLVLLEWTFERSTVTVVPLAEGHSIEHTFAKPGHYEVTLVATDSVLGKSSITRIVTIDHTPPTAAMNVTPSPVFRGQEVRFEDVSIDEDGDSIVNSSWVFGDGAIAYGREVHHVYTELGARVVELAVVDSEGQSSTVTTTLRVLNRPPIVAASFAPERPRADEPVTFSAEGVDPDTNGPITFEWAFSDDTRFVGQQVTRAFRAGNHTVMLRGHDADGGVSAPWIAAFRVGS